MTNVTDIETAFDAAIDQTGQSRAFLAGLYPYIRLVTHNFWHRRSFRAAVFVFCVGLGATPAAAAAGKLLHASLIGSVPAGDEQLTRAPRSIRLVFSEAVVAELSRIVMTAPDGSTASLGVALDPNDPRVLIGPLGALTDGGHRVAWRIVSADGHPVAGIFFSLTQTTRRLGVVSADNPGIRAGCA